jgi:hypothetical protein
MIVPCKVDGGWSAWSDFGACSVSCGAGVKYSTRMCNNPRAEHGGKECEGNSQKKTKCDMPPCKGKESFERDFLSSCFSAMYNYYNLFVIIKIEFINKDSVATNE